MGRYRNFVLLRMLPVAGFRNQCRAKAFWCIVFFFFAFHSLSQPAQSYYFRKLDITNGLSQNTVNAILQDRNGFMWFGTKDGLNRYDGVTVKVFKGNDGSATGLDHSFITTLFEDREGNIWVGTDVGAYLYNPRKEQFERFSVVARNGRSVDRTVNKIGSGPGGSILFAVHGRGLFSYNTVRKELLNFPFEDKGSVRDFYPDRQNGLWISFYKGLYVTHDHFKTLKPYTSNQGKELFKDELINSLFLAEDNKLYAGSETNGMMELDLHTGEVKKLALPAAQTGPLFVRCIYPNSANELWIGTEIGVFVYDRRTGTSRHLQHARSDPFSISDNAIYSLYKDKEGGMWIGSYFGGVNYFPRQTTYFEKYYPTDNKGALKGQRVREIVRGHGDQLWIGTEDAGLFRFNRSDRTFEHFAASKGFSNIHGLCMDGDLLWVGTFSQGVRVINTRTGQIKSYTAGDHPATIRNNFVFSVRKASTGHIWLGTSMGLIRYNKSTGAFETVPELDNNLVYDILEDSKGNIWVATYTNGVFLHDAVHKKWMHFQHSDDKRSLPHNKVLSIFEDSNKQIWLTTEGRGFCKFEPEQGTFKRYPARPGPLNGVVYQMVEDGKGFFWLTTNSGLVRFDPRNGLTKTYTQASGLLDKQFNYKSGFRDDDGTILLGSINGLIAFKPDTFTENRYIPPVYITGFLIFNQPAVAGQPGSPLHKSIIFSDSITLKHDQDHFSLRIAALSYQAPEINFLQYKLEGLEDKWQRVTESSLVSYSNLASGKYVFRVRGSNNDGLWNPQERRLHITILAPFYLTRWAYAIYTGVFIGLVYMLVRFLKRRQRFRQTLFIQKLEQDKEREIHDAMIRFFTNITHEIRTPLTLIRGPLENIMVQSNLQDEDTLDDLRIMKKNTDRLLDLTNQLLDFRKIEKSVYTLNVSECNISKLITELQQSFSPLVKEYNRTFALEMDNDDFTAVIDKEAVTKIISNLFSNAVKYAANTIRAELITTQADGMFEIRVATDGPEIGPEQYDDIFKPFIRLHEHGQINGTGLGMHLARTLAELHGGSLRILRDEIYNVFSLVLPAHRENAVTVPVSAEENSAAGLPVYSAGSEPANRVHTILIVEDNGDMQRFIRKLLADKYHVLMAANGTEALEVLKKNMVTLVISDIMMPQMTGIELCGKIKSDIRYSHIPLILLTAKTNLQSKIEGMETGADAYVEKPFSPEYLAAMVANLILGREKLRDAFLKNPMVTSSTMITTETDKAFLDALREAIHRNIQNPDFKMEDLAESLNISRASFYRKIKGVLDMSPNEYLRLERLKMAAILIRENKYQIGEICHLVGFNSPSYFSRCFQEQFGVAPKDFN